MKSSACSTLLLVKLIRFRVFAGMAAAFCFLFWLGLVDSHSHIEAISMIAVAGLGFSLLMRLHTLLGDNMFPVTNRQIAWIPMGVWVLVSLAGFAATCLAQAVGFSSNMSNDQIVEFWSESTRLLPIISIWLLMVWRLIRINFSWCWIIFNIPLGFSSSSRFGKSFTGQGLELIDSLWPLWLAGCIFLIYEAPKLTAVLRRMDTSGFSIAGLKTRQVQLRGPSRPSTATRLANGVMGLAIGVCVALSLFGGMGPNTSQTNFFLLGIFALLSLYGLNYLWWQNRASGMTQSRALKVLLLEFTIFGYAFRDCLGVARGDRVVCRYCDKWRMVWQTRCPHCGDGFTSSADPDIAALSEVKPSRVALVRQTDPLAMYFRDIFPAGLLIVIIIRHFDYLVTLFKQFAM